MSATVVRAFVACSPGIEPLLETELARLGARATAERGGVEITGSLELLWKVHRECRLGESVRVRLKPFEARSFAELERELERLPWHAYLRRADVGALRIDVTCRRSRLYHSDAVAERVARAIATRLGGATAGAGVEDVARHAAPQRLFVRILRDRVQVSVDASGERLHRRGYRTHVSRAPVRETLAAALALVLDRVLADRTAPVWDPFCGSGTLLIEWLALRSGIAPGCRRGFAFEAWPIHDADAYAAWQRGQPVAAGVGDARVLGSDLSAAAVAAATSNAVRSGLDGACRFWTGDFREAAAQVPAGAGIVGNPPWGVRLARSHVAELLRAFDELLTERPDLRPVVLLCGDTEYPKRSRHAWRVELTCKSGGLPAGVLVLEDRAAAVPA